MEPSKKYMRATSSKEVLDRYKDYKKDKMRSIEQSERKSAATYNTITSTFTLSPGEKAHLKRQMLGQKYMQGKGQVINETMGFKK